jgi:hypothetical protein
MGLEGLNLSFFQGRPIISLYTTVTLTGRKVTNKILRYQGRVYLCVIEPYHAVESFSSILPEVKDVYAGVF